jgi:Domain of unknown function (DUF4331)
MHGRVFAGQRKDPFVVNLGETFDLIDIAHPIGEAFANSPRDDVADKNVTSLVRFLLRVATQDIETARAASDRRYNGYAEAALGPWIALVLRTPVLLLHATLRQATHDFHRALKDLNRVIFADPRRHPVAHALLCAVCRPNQRTVPIRGRTGAWCAMIQDDGIAVRQARRSDIMRAATATCGRCADNGAAR